MNWAALYKSIPGSEVAVVVVGLVFAACACVKAIARGAAETRSHSARRRSLAAPRCAAQEIKPRLADPGRDTGSVPR